MTAECGVIYGAGEALCRRKSILQHHVNPRHSGAGVSQEARNIQKRREVFGFCDKNCLEYETDTQLTFKHGRMACHLIFSSVASIMLDIINPRRNLLKEEVIGQFE